MVLSLSVLTGCMAQMSTFSIKQTNVGQVAIGDTTAEVRRKLGEPTQIVTEAADQEGRPLAVTWIYEAEAVAERGLVGRVHADPTRPVSVDATRHTENIGGTTYRILFVDGRVSQLIERP